MIWWYKVCLEHSKMTIFQPQYKYHGTQQLKINCLFIWQEEAWFVLDMLKQGIEILDMRQVIWYM